MATPIRIEKSPNRQPKIFGIRLRSAGLHCFIRRLFVCIGRPRTDTCCDSLIELGDTVEALVVVVVARPVLRTRGADTMIAADNVHPVYGGSPCNLFFYQLLHSHRHFSRFSDGFVVHRVLFCCCKRKRSDVGKPRPYYYRIFSTKVGHVPVTITFLVLMCWHVPVTMEL